MQDEIINMSIRNTNVELNTTGYFGVNLLLDHSRYYSLVYVTHIPLGMIIIW